MESKPVYLNTSSESEINSRFVANIDSAVEKAIKKFYKETTQEEQLLTVDETLKFLKCSKQSLWTWRKNGILPSYRLGNRVYYKKSDIFNKLIKQE